jgi:hypothetical protein
MLVFRALRLSDMTMTDAIAICQPARASHELRLFHEKLFIIQFVHSFTIVHKGLVLFCLFRKF